jgi:large subunit ribosomal protein L5
MAKVKQEASIKKAAPKKIPAKKTVVKEIIVKKAVAKKVPAKKTPVKTSSDKRIPDWGVRPGVNLGLKVTLRGEDAKTFLLEAFVAKDKKILARNFDKAGNFGFGIREHIDLPGIKYDPKLGIIGLDILVALKKRGYRVKHRKIRKTKVGEKQRVSKEEAIEFVKSMGVEIA